MHSKIKVSDLKDPQLVTKREKVHDCTMPELCRHLQRNKSYFAEALARLQKVADPTVPTMCVSVRGGRYVLAYHPEWYQYLTTMEAWSVLVHEIMHVELNHIARFNKMLENIVDDEQLVVYKSVANAAADLAVNELLNECRGLQLPDSALLAQKFNLPPLLMMEEYVELLAERVEVVKVPVKIMMPAKKSTPDMPSDGSGNGSGNQQPGDGQDDPTGNGQSPTGGQAGQDDSGNQGGGGTQISLGHKDLDDAANNNNHQWDIKPEENDNKSLRDIMSDLDKQTQDIREEAATAAQSTRGCGSVPGFILTKLGANTTPALSSPMWESLLKKIATEVSESFTEYRINKLNRARLGLRTFLGLWGADEPMPKFRIAAGIDTSGSMTDEQLNHIRGLLQGLLKTNVDFELKIFEYDCRISRRYMVKRHGELPDDVLGRGGTNFDPFFGEISSGVDAEGKRFKPNIIFNFTDGEAHPPKEEYIAKIGAVPYYWVLTKYGRTPTPEFGRQLRMDI